ncbi:hypothetical protein [Yersinia phage vB_YenM_P778]
MRAALTLLISITGLVFSYCWIVFGLKFLYDIFFQNIPFWTAFWPNFWDFVVYQFLVGILLFILCMIFTSTTPKRW